MALQAELIEVATLNDREEIIGSLFDLDSALLRRQPAPQSQAIEHAFVHANTHLIPPLARIWPVPDDLPHAAAMGTLARVKQWFAAPTSSRQSGAVIDFVMVFSKVSRPSRAADNHRHRFESSHAGEAAPGCESAMGLTRHRLPLGRCQRDRVLADL